MRILAVADIHGSSRAVDAVNHFIKNEKPDVMTISGDITHFGPPDWAFEFLESLPIPAFAVNGNCDPPGVVQAIEKSKVRSLIGRTEDFGGLTFRGIGYPVAKSQLRDKTKADVVVSHVPALGFNDVIGGSNTGDSSVLEYVRAVEPQLLLTGHIHEARGITELDNTLCINPGPARDGLGAIIDMRDELTASLLKY